MGEGGCQWYKSLPTQCCSYRAVGLLTFFCFLPSRLSSRLMWLNSLTSFPRGPLTVTVLPFNLTSTVRKTEAFRGQTAHEFRLNTDTLETQASELLVSYHRRGCRQSDCWEWSSFCGRGECVRLMLGSLFTYFIIWDNFASQVRG